MRFDRVCALVGFIVFLSAGSVLAQEHVYRVGFDLDNNASTGCDMAVNDLNFSGTIPGIEVIVNLRVDPNSDPLRVSPADVEECVGAGFGPPTVFDGVGWAVGLNNGYLGADVVEGELPVTYPLASDVIGLVYASISDQGSEDVVLSDNDGPLPAAFGLAIPTAGTWATIFLGALICAAAIRILRRRGLKYSQAAVTAILICLVVSVVFAAVITPDGLVGDWSTVAPLATDLQGDPTLADPAADILQVSVTSSGPQISVRLDIADLHNGAPTDIALDNNDVEENQPAGTVVGNLSTVDPDGGDTHTYSLAAGVGDTDNASFQIVGNLLQTAVAFDYETQNSLSIRIRTDDGNGGPYEEVFTITVNDVNEAPSITSDGGGATASVSAAENQTAVTDVQATDDGDSEGAGLTYAITGGADQARFSIAAATGVLTFDVAPDFENPDDAGTNNVYDVQVTVTDSGDLTDVQDIAVTVTDVNEAPVITSDGGGATASVSAAENQTAVTDVQSTDDSDSEGAGLTYAITGGADQARFSIAAATGVLTFNVAPDFENPVDAGTNNVYDVQVTVTDSGALTDAQDISVIVIDVNDAPVITSDGGGATATVRIAGDLGSVTDVQAADLEGDTEGAGLTYSITGGADQALFSINPGTGVLGISNDGYLFVNPNDANADAVYEVQVTVTDSGGLTDTQDINVTYIPVSIGNRVWADSNNNQIQDPGEFGVDGVLVNLMKWSSPSVVHRSSVTVRDSQTQREGYFIFDDLPEDDYIVQVAPRNFMNLPDDGDPSNGIEGMLYNSIAGGPYFSSEDTDLTHLIDDGRDLNDNGIDANFPATDGIRSSTFRLRVTTEASPTNPPDDLDLNTDVGEGTSGELDSNADMTLDFGFYIPLVSLGNRVFFDLDNNRQLNGGDTGASGVILNLFMTDGAGNVVDQDGDGGSFGDPDDIIATDLTDANGYYIFDGLWPGFYVVVVDEDNFLTGGVLQSYFSSQDVGTPTDLYGHQFHDNDTIEDGIDSAAPHLGGIRSPEIDLTPGSETVTESDRGPEGNGEPNIQATNSNLTIDFGFYIP